MLGYLISEGFRNVFKNKKSTVASLVIMCATMFIFGIFFAIGENVNHMIDDIEKQQGMQVFIKNDDSITQEQKTQLGEQIRNLDGVNTVVFRTKDESLNQIKDSVFKENPEMVEMYEGDRNPLQDSYVVTLTDLEKSEQVKNAIEKNDIVDNVEIRSNTINTLVKIANGINTASIVILVLLVLISIFIITNTIKLTVHARRKEISIMKYVGATNGFIRWPFVVEGIIIGVISALISIVLLGFAYNGTANAVLNLLQTTASIVILVLLVLISIFIITNTIKLTVHARRKEISIMKYVGATNGFIRWPFVVEGIIIGVISALISIVLLGFAYNGTANAVLNLLQTTALPLGIISFSDMFGLVLTVYLSLGIGIGVIGSMISMRKYIEV